MSNLETAEQLDGQYQMDFEALLGEARELQRKLTELDAKIRGMGLLDLPQAAQEIEIDFSRDGVLIEQGIDKPDRTCTLEELLEVVAKNEI